jgi:hypothetical protein
VLSPAGELALGLDVPVYIILHDELYLKLDLENPAVAFI